jgi:MFS family permease
MLLLLWRACLRLDLIPSPRWRLALLALVSGGYSTFFCYRCARYDGITMLVAAAIFYCWTFRRTPVACAAVFLLGVVTPWAGLQLLPFYGLFGLLILFFFGKLQLPRLASAALGTVLGLGLLFALYAHEGVLEQFKLNMRHHGSTELLRDLSQGRIPGYLISKDFSFFLLFPVTAALAFNRFRRHEFKIKSFLGFGVISSAFVFFGMFLSGKFPTYYTWMVYIPLGICLCAVAARAADPSPLRKTIALTFAAAIFVGLSPHVAIALSDWSERDYSKVTAFVNQNTTPADCAFGEDNVYYALKWRVAGTYIGRIADSMTPAEKSRLTVLFIRPGHLAAVTNRLGGDWVKTGAALVPKKTGLMGTNQQRWGWLAIYNYALEVYRRRPNPDSNSKP